MRTPELFGDRLANQGGVPVAEITQGFALHQVDLLFVESGTHLQGVELQVIKILDMVLVDVNAELVGNGLPHREFNEGRHT